MRKRSLRLKLQLTSEHTVGKASKEKGASFERLVCEKLSRWIMPDSDRGLLWRSSMSGGRATVARAAGKKLTDQSSDLCSIAPESAPFTSVFTVECKHYKTLNIPSGVIHGKQELALFWRQVCRDAAHANKRPLMIARQNSWPILAFVRSPDYPQFFGPVSDYECARLLKLSTRQSYVSMFILEDLLRSAYVESRFIK